MSFGTATDAYILREFVARSLNAGKLLVAAAGNVYDAPALYPSVLYPAKYPNVVAVSGMLPNDTFASFVSCDFPPYPQFVVGSRYGPEVTLAAPFWARSMTLNGGYRELCGTSMATPVVTGVAALVWGEEHVMDGAAGARPLDVHSG